MKYIHNDPLLKERRKTLRKNSSYEEKVLWNHLRGKGLGRKFRRQSSIGPFIVDFYCPELKLVIEIDGGDHRQKQEYDTERECFLSEQGCNILRFSNDDIRCRLQSTLNLINEYILKIAALP